MKLTLDRSVEIVLATLTLMLHSIVERFSHEKRGEEYYNAFIKIGFLNKRDNYDLTATF